MKKKPTMKPEMLNVVQPATPMMLMPAAPGLCAICATKHDPAQPHNQQSIHYQYWFYASSNGRWPTWTDAMAHCSDEVKAFWIAELQKRGVKIDAPGKKPKDEPPTGGRVFELEDEK